jgi:hypothetical protein
MAGVYEKYADADGIPGHVALYWTRYVPTSGGPTWPVVCMFHPGGYKSGGHDNGTVSNSLQAAGFVVLACEYRLAPPANAMKSAAPPNGNNHPVPGQDTVNDSGHYPKQTDDVQRAIRAARARVECDGRVYAIGGSAGGSHVAYMMATGTAGDDRPDLCGILSCGVSNLADTILLSLPPTPGETNPYDAIANYTGIPYLYPVLPNPTDLALLATASPVTYMTPDMPPCYVLMSVHDSLGIPTSTGLVGQSDQGPLEDQVQNGLIPKLTSPAVGFTRSTLAIPEYRKVKYDVVQSPGHQHAFQVWDTPIDGIAGHTTAGQAMIAWLQGGIPIPPSGGAFQGVIVGISGSQDIAQQILDDPNIDCIGINTDWKDYERLDGVYEYTVTNLVPRIQAAVAAGKKVQLTIATMAGADTNFGKTPDFVFTAIGNTPAGNPGSVTDGVTIGSEVITSALANFSDADVHRQITGTDIPGAPTYIGTVTNGTTAKLSSSPTSQVNVNATGSHSGCAWTIAGRPRVAPNNNDMVHGTTFTYNDPSPFHSGPDETTIPVFWEPTFGKYKKRMINRLGYDLFFTNLLTPLEKSSIVVFRIAYANSQTEDWNVPHGKDPSDPSIDWNQQWLNSPIGTTFATRGAGYTTAKMNETAIKQTSHFALTDGQTFSNKRLVSLSANWTLADVGKGVEGAGIPNLTFIASWTSPTEVQLTNNTTATASNVVLDVRFRQTGFFDVATAAFPGVLIETAIGNNGDVLDKTAADLAGDPDIPNFLAKTTCGNINFAYPNRLVTTVNSFSTRTPLAPGTGTLKLLWDIHQRGNFVAGQDLWFCFNDPNFRMNGGVAGDPTTISNTVGNIIFGYGANYREMYSADALGIPGAIEYSHDLFTGGIIIEPPPPPLPSFIPPPSLNYQRLNFRDHILFAIADLLAIEWFDLTPARARRWISEIFRHLEYAWTLHAWADLTITEERAFRRIWNAIDDWKVGDEVYYLGQVGVDGLVTGQGYYRCFLDAPRGTVPTNIAFFNSFELAANDFFVEELQRCRRRLGQVLEVFPSDPRDVTRPTPRSLPWQMSTRGLEVFRFGGATVFIKYRAVTYHFSASDFDSTKLYKTLDLQLWSDGDVYRALQPVQGIDPGNTSADQYWALVPFPAFLAGYVTYMVASDEAADLQQKGMFQKEAAKFLARAEDKHLEVGANPPRYRLTGPRRWGRQVVLAVTLPPADTVNTISDTCLNEWGDVVPNPPT